jgi:hypothetical protein
VRRHLSATGGVLIEHFAIPVWGAGKDRAMK